MVTGSHHPQVICASRFAWVDGSTANQDVIEELEETMAPRSQWGSRGNIAPRISF